MISFASYQKMALSLPQVTEEPHFEKTSFRVKKKIFAVFNAAHHRACIRLRLEDQDVFGIASKGLIYPVPNKWGKFGWTLIDMKKIKKDLFKDALLAAYCHVAPEPLARLVEAQEGY